jgi:hypothetical protein
MMDAGHSHGPSPYLVNGCPLCDAEKAARNQAIEHLHEALHLLSLINRFEGQPTIRINLGPINLTGDDVQHCHSVDLPAKHAEALADAIDSMNACAGSEAPTSSEPVVAAEHEAIGTGEWSAAAVAQNDPDLYAVVTNLFMLVEPESYLDDVFAAQSPEAAMAAFEQMVTGEWDGEL